jgi:hypothetical protein
MAGHGTEKNRSGFSQNFRKSAQFFFIRLTRLIRPRRTVVAVWASEEKNTGRRVTLRG